MFSRHPAFALAMLTLTGAGDAYTFKELAEMHHKAGFGEATAISIRNGPNTIGDGAGVANPIGIESIENSCPP